MNYAIKTNDATLHLVQGEFEIMPSGDLMFLEEGSESIVAYFKAKTWDYVIRLHQTKPIDVPNPFSRN